MQHGRQLCGTRWPLNRWNDTILIQFSLAKPSIVRAHCNQWRCPSDLTCFVSSQQIDTTYFATVQHSQSPLAYAALAHPHLSLPLRYRFWAEASCMIILPRLTPTRPTCSIDQLLITFIVILEPEVRLLIPGSPMEKTFHCDIHFLTKISQLCKLELDSVFHCRLRRRFRWSSRPAPRLLYEWKSILSKSSPLLKAGISFTKSMIIPTLLSIFHQLKHRS